MDDYIKGLESKQYTSVRCGHCGKFGHHHDTHKEKKDKGFVDGAFNVIKIGKMRTVPFKRKDKKSRGNMGEDPNYISAPAFF